MITPQPVRPGFPCFGVAISGDVEATRDNDADKNRGCRSSSFGNTLVDWAVMNVVGMRNASAFTTEPDLEQFANRVALNPARVPASYPPSPAFDDAQARIESYVVPGLAHLAAWAGMAI